MKRDLLYFLNYNSTVKDVVDVLDKTGRDGLAFLHDDNGILSQVFTDGDIRRGLLNSVKLDDSISTLIKVKEKYNKNKYVSASSKDSNFELIKKMDEFGIRQIIILDENTKEIVGITHREDLINTKNHRNTSVLIMAGGYGKRLLPYTLDTPKPMIRIEDKPFLEYQIQNFISFGFTNFYLSVFYLKDIIKNYFLDGSKLGISIKYIEEKLPLGTAGCVSLISEKNFDSLIIINGDIYAPIDFDNLLEFHKRNNSEITMCVKEFKYQIPYGTIKTDGLNLVEIVEKPFVNNFINAGIYVINTNIIQEIPINTKIDITTLIEQSIKKGKSIKCYPIIHEWIDMGTPKDLELVKEIFKNKNR